MTYLEIVMSLIEYNFCVFARVKNDCIYFHGILENAVSIEEILQINLRVLALC